MNVKMEYVQTQIQSHTKFEKMPDSNKTFSHESNFSFKAIFDIIHPAEVNIADFGFHIRTLG